VTQIKYFMIVNNRVLNGHFFTEGKRVFMGDSILELRDALKEDIRPLAECNPEDIVDEDDKEIDFEDFMDGFENLTEFNVTISGVEFDVVEIFKGKSGLKDMLNQIKNDYISNEYREYVLNDNFEIIDWESGDYELQNKGETDAFEEKISAQLEFLKKCAGSYDDTALKEYISIIDQEIYEKWMN